MGEKPLGYGEKVLVLSHGWVVETWAYTNDGLHGRNMPLLPEDRGRTWARGWDTDEAKLFLAVAQPKKA